MDKALLCQQYTLDCCFILLARIRCLELPNPHIPANGGKLETRGYNNYKILVQFTENQYARHILFDFVTRNGCWLLSEIKIYSETTNVSDRMAYLVDISLARETRTRDLRIILLHVLPCIS